MKKAVLSNRIILEVDDALYDELQAELTYKIAPAYTGKAKKPMPVIIKQVSRIRPGLVSIPAGRIDLIPEEYTISDRRVLNPVEFPTFQMELRPDQQTVFDKVEDNCIINAYPGWGKTFTGAAIAGKLGQKTLVVCHTVPLMNQWISEIEKVYGFTPDKIGSGSFEYGTPIVVGSVRTLYNRLDSIKDEFGTIILDEMHHVSSRTFSAIINETRARYKIGLSGTIERKDGRHVVFRDYFSGTVITPEKANVLEPEVHLINTAIQIPGGSGVPWANRITELAFNPEYQELVIFLADAYRKLGHKVLVVSDRVHLLNTCGAQLEESSVVITGEMTDHQEREKQIKRIQTDKDILFGTLSIFSEGFSESRLSALILATPINNEPLLTQICARINRKREGKKHPVVVDIQLGGGTGKRQAQARQGFYMKEGWKVTSF